MRVKFEVPRPPSRFNDVAYRMIEHPGVLPHTMPADLAGHMLKNGSHKVPKPKFTVAVIIRLSHSRVCRLEVHATCGAPGVKLFLDADLQPVLRQFPYLAGLRIRGLRVRPCVHPSVATCPSP